MFNDSASESYGKAKGKNASIGEDVSFAYTTALNHLLRKGFRQRIQVGDASTVFWAGKPNPFEVPTKDDPDRSSDKVRSLLSAVNTGGTVPKGAIY